MMADHLGHSVNIHTSVYRLQSNLIERTKVSKILIAIENGGIAKTAEIRQLDEIEIPVNELIEDQPSADVGIARNDETDCHIAEDTSIPDTEAMAKSKRVKRYWSEAEKRLFESIYTDHSKNLTKEQFS
ncbi:hypothetical protein EB796_014398 [Bugula neritina]|uniref:Uncharacterized protein n=1 Tax=Bugula neritina TaxID=10212 RepID=A0A7J7JNU8_BUGNE|nr:hypothetical protein EB796_014398 [Bugula neritina]